MTILQLKYVIEISNSATMREAATRLYVTQPALSSSLRDLETELGFRIFERNNRGVMLTTEGAEFIEYAKKAVSQYQIIEDRYIVDSSDLTRFAVSMQHYVFAVHAFINTMKKVDLQKYSLSVYETRTYEVLTNVRELKSEIGIISYALSNESIMKKVLKEYNLEFFPLMERNTYVYLWKNHPLADRKDISLHELEQYPCISFEQGGSSELYLSEEALGNYNFERIIKTNDRATSMELIAGMNGYSIGTGIMSDSVVLEDNLVCIKLNEEDPLTIGFIKRKGVELSSVGKIYVEELKEYSDALNHS